MACIIDGEHAAEEQEEQGLLEEHLQFHTQEQGVDGPPGSCDPTTSQSETTSEFHHPLAPGCTTNSVQCQTRQCPELRP